MLPTRPVAISPRRQLSQNFLINPAVARRLVQAVGAGTGDVVLEIGAGTGALTQELLTLPVHSVIAVELDSRAAEALRSRFANESKLHVVEGDILALDVEALDIPSTARLFAVGNIPYHLTGPILFWLLERADRFHRFVLMVQKEVAQRIVAKPATRAYGIPSVACALVATAVQVLFTVPPGAFYPRPKVTSAVIGVDSAGVALVEEATARTMELVKAAFNQRRKKLRNALMRYLQQQLGSRWEQVASLPLMDKRAEELSPDEFRKLATLIHTIAEQQQ